MRLITKITNKNGEQVNYRIQRKINSSSKISPNEIWITVNNEKVGYMKYSIQNESLYIHRMDNYSLNSENPFRHVGSVLFEYAFHKSIEYEKGGCIELEAIGNSPAPYFNMGLRKKSNGFLWLKEKIDEYQLTQSTITKKEIESDESYETLKYDAQHNAYARGLSSLSFEEVLQYGKYSSYNDKFEKAIDMAKSTGQALTELDVIRHYMNGIMYLPPEIIAKKKLDYRFKPIGSSLFFSYESAVVRLKNCQLMELVKNGKLDSSNALEIDIKLRKDSKIKPIVDLLLSPSGLKMMKKNYISAWFSIVYFDEKSLKSILSKIELFEKNHIKSISQVIEMPRSYFTFIFSKEGLSLFDSGQLFLSKNGFLKNHENKTLSDKEIKTLFKQGDLSPKNKTMTKMRNPLELLQWRTQNEKTLQ
ncbi:hypothetical protein [Legionella feeleii]|uniref:Uncharacterized protein n=1 Tax=Legionella feeleii TaxID=453 RepID=A0A378KK90_9GAMM|nr:hypothetical protein [Legionella feeleii]STX88355.1 Uncharacterised protein [Legionella feeleii]